MTKEEKAKKYFEEGLKAHEKGEYDKARELYEKSINEDATTESAYNNLAVLLIEEFNEFEEAKKLYEIAIKLDSENPSLYSNLAVLYYRHIKNNQKAQQYFAKYRELSKTTEKEYVTKNSKTIQSINSLSIENYFAIKNIKLENLTDKKEIYFLGENGDGKTILLQAIVLAFQQNYIKDYADKVLIGEALEALSNNKLLNLKAKDNKQNEYDFLDLNFAKNLYAYGVNRSRKDEEHDDKYGFMSLFSHKIRLNNPAEWLQKLDYYESRKDYKSPFPLKSAIKILKSILDDNIEIDVSPDGVVFTERGTDLEFQQLSDGYKSVLIWVSDLIVKLARSQPEAKEAEDFEGVVLIDEIDLHLHPKWAYSIVGKLRNWFPKIQWIITTHSPDVIRGAGEHSVFYKLYKEFDTELKQKVIKISEPYSIDELSDLMANSIVTSPLFDLSHARMEVFDNETDDLKSDADYWYAQIHKQVRDDIRRMKSEGKVHISKNDVQKMISAAIEKYS